MQHSALLSYVDGLRYGLSQDRCYLNIWTWFVCVCALRMLPRSYRVVACRLETYRASWRLIVGVLAGCRGSCRV